MKMVATRDLVAKSAKIMSDLETDGYVVVTKDGKPRSIMIPTSESSFIEDYEAIVYMRAQNSLKKAQLRSVRTGKSKMTMAQIDAEIAKARKNR